MEREVCPVPLATTVYLVSSLETATAYATGKSVLGDVIAGVSYVQQSDIGVAGGVAKLNAQGEVVDANGNPVTVPGDLTALNTAITNETNRATAAESSLNTTLTAEFQTGDTNTLTSAKSYTDTQFESLTASVNSQVSGQTNAITRTAPGTSRSRRSRRPRSPAGSRWPAWLPCTR